MCYQTCVKNALSPGIIRYTDILKLSRHAVHPYSVLFRGKRQLKPTEGGLLLQSPFGVQNTNHIILRLFDFALESGFLKSLLDLLLLSLASAFDLNSLKTLQGAFIELKTAGFFSS